MPPENKVRSSLPFTIVHLIFSASEYNHVPKKVEQHFIFVIIYSNCGDEGMWDWWQLDSSMQVEDGLIRCEKQSQGYNHSDLMHLSRFVHDWHSMHVIDMSCFCRGHLWVWVVISNCTSLSRGSGQIMVFR